MHRVWYANTDFLTDDRVADALTRYAEVLALVDSADVVRVPGIDRGGNAREVTVLIGPSSQILTMKTDDGHVELEVDAALADLDRRRRRRLPSAAELIEAGWEQEDAIGLTGNQD